MLGPDFGIPQQQNPAQSFWDWLTGQPNQGYSPRAPLWDLPEGIGLGPGAGPDQPRTSFNPDVLLNPSQTENWTGTNNPWNGWMMGQLAGADPISPRAWYDSIRPNYSGSGSNPFGEFLRQSMPQSYNTYPWGPDFQQQMEQRQQDPFSGYYPGGY